MNASVLASYRAMMPRDCSEHVAGAAEGHVDGPIGFEQARPLQIIFGLETPVRSITQL